MTLIQAWADSLTLFKPKNLQLFVMVTIKSIKETYISMAYYWSWLMALLIGIYGVQIFFSSDELMIKNIALHEYIMPIARWLYQVLIFATCLAARPSMIQKNYIYFRSYMIFFGYFTICLCIIPLDFWPTPLYPLGIWSILFFLDTEKDLGSLFTSMWYALKMVVYNFPLMLCMQICFGIIKYLFINVFFIPSLIQNIAAVLMLPIGICIHTNIYVKKLHDQFDVYFEQPQRDTL